MFQLELHQFLFVYAGLFLVTIMLAGWAHNFRRTRHERDALKDVLRCRICAFEFRDETGEPLPKCPRCSSKVERRTLSRI